MEGKSSFFNIVLLFILAFLSLTLAALAGFVFIGGGSKSATTKTVVVTKAPEYKPTSAELGTHELVKEKSQYNLKNLNPDADPNTSTPPIIMATVSIKYLLVAPKGSLIKAPAIAVEEEADEMKSLVGTYFLSLTKEEALTPDAKEKASEILMEKFNELLNESVNAPEEKKIKIIYKVIFPDWSVY